MSAKTPVPVISVVVPAFNEEVNLPSLFKAIEEALGKSGDAYEVVVIDDGSRDSTWRLIAEQAARDPRVRGVRFARNFGHQVAVTAGLEHARGQCVAIIDADLQDPPRVLPDMITLWRAGNEVVYGVRRRRKEGALKRACYHAFYRLLARLADVPIPLDSGDFCLMDRRVVDLMATMPERRRFVRGLRAWVGLRQVGLEYEREARHAGEPKYTWSGLVRLATDGLVSFSTKPLQIATRLGFVVSGVACASALAYVVLRLAGVGTWPTGFASLFVGMLFLFGVQFVLIGILGEYVGRIHIEVKGRPMFVVDETTDQATEGRSKSRS